MQSINYFCLLDIIDYEEDYSFNIFSRVAF